MRPCESQNATTLNHLHHASCLNRHARHGFNLAQLLEQLFLFSLCITSKQAHHFQWEHPSRYLHFI